MAKTENDDLLLDETGKKNGESTGNKIITFLIAIAIVIIWLGVFALLIKLDVGGVGSKIFYPALKDVPIINRILPDVEDDGLSLSSDYSFDSVDDAIARIKELEAQVDSLTSINTANSQYISELEEEVTRLQTFEDEQKEFEKRKLEFDKEVVYAKNAPDIEEYKKYYEEIDADNAAEIYRQVVEQMQVDEQILEQSERYANMEPASAAAILDVMSSGDLEIVAQILENMETDKAALIMAELSSATAAKVTKMMVSGIETEGEN